MGFLMLLGVCGDFRAMGMWRSGPGIFGVFCGCMIVVVLRGLWALRFKVYGFWSLGFMGFGV